MFALLFREPLLFFIWALAFLFALAIHEFSHALAGTWLGDGTAKREGRLTLNPLAHVDPVGFVSVLLIGFGWGKPVPFNPYALRWPKWGPTMVAAAGPLSNFLTASLMTILLFVFAPALGCRNLLTLFLLVSLQLNIVLMVFNFIPLPPLDGSKALLALLAHPNYFAIRNFIELQGPMILLVLVLGDSLLNIGLFSGLLSGVWNGFNRLFNLPCTV